MIGFLMREAWRNFANLGIIGLLCLVSLTMTLSIFGIASWGYFAVEDWKSGVLGRFQIEAFLSEDIDSSQAGEIAADISQFKHIEKVQYISKDVAAQRFIDQFGDELFDPCTKRL